MGPLEGLRVVELGSGFAAPFAGKMFADYGADVVKIEPPGGDYLRSRGPFAGGTPGLERSGSFFYVNTNKRSAILDFDDPASADLLKRLIARSDVLIEDTPYGWLDARGLGIETLRAINHRLIVTSVSSFGRSGPYKTYRGEDLIGANSSGLAYASRPRGFATMNIEIAPLRPAGNQPSYFVGLSAAIATLAALWRRRSSGSGAAIDLSVQEASITAQSNSVAQLSYQGHIVGRASTPISGPIALVKCRDGWVWLQCSEEKHWRDFVELMGSPEWAELEIFKDRFTRGEHWDALEPLILEWTMQHDKEEIFRLSQAKRIPHAPSYTFPELLQNTQLQAREYFKWISHPVMGEVGIPSTPAKFSKTPWKAGPPPLLGAHTAEVFDRLPPVEPNFAVQESAVPDKPLKGIRVIDFSWVHAGPFCGMLLAELGAEVLKVETNKRWDIVRRLPPMADREFGINRSGYFNSVNRGKRSCTLDLGKPEAIELAKDLIRTADVVLENFSAGVMDRLGLGYDELKKIRPDIIMTSISGYGATGPDNRYVAYGPPLTAFSGLVQVTGYPGGGPQAMGAAWPDPVAAQTSATAILTALNHRAETGEGQWIDISQAEATIAFLGDLITETTMNGRQPPRRGNVEDGLAPFGCYRSDGKDAWVAIAVTDNATWRRFAAAIGRPELGEDPRYATMSERWERRVELDAMVTEWTLQSSPREAMELLQEAGVPASASFNNGELLEDKHLAEREYFIVDNHPETGPRRMVGMPWRFGGLPMQPASPAPLLGEGNEYVFSDLLGMPSGKVEKLIEEETIH